jgi:transcription elongation GreA/GreB family factor
VSWVELAKAPGFHYGSQFVRVDAEWIAARQAINDSLRARGWFPPVLIAHADEGQRSGDVVGLSSATIDGRLTFLGAVAWNDADASSKIAARIMTDVSVGLYPLQNPDTGDVLEMAVAEVSLTTLPHMLGDSRILNAQAGGTMDMPDSGPSVEDRLVAMETMVEQLAGMVTELLPDQDATETALAAEGTSMVESTTITAANGDDEDEDVLPELEMAFVVEEGGSFQVRKGDPPFDVLSEYDNEEDAVAEMERLHRDNDPAQSSRGANAREAYDRWKEEQATMSNDQTDALKARIAALETKLAAEEEAKARAVYNAGVKLGSTIELTQAVADALYPLYRNNAEAFDVIKASVKAPEAPATVDAPVIKLTNPWAASGIADDVAEPAKYTNADALADARVTAKANGTDVTAEYKINLQRVEG